MVWTFCLAMSAAIWETGVSGATVTGFGGHAIAHRGAQHLFHPGEQVGGNLEIDMEVQDIDGRRQFQVPGPLHQVALGDDPHQAAVFIHHRQAADLAVLQGLGQIRDGGLRADREDLRGHDITRVKHISPSARGMIPRLNSASMGGKTVNKSPAIIPRGPCRLTK